PSRAAATRSVDVEPVRSTTRTGPRRPARPCAASAAATASAVSGTRPRYPAPVAPPTAAGCRASGTAVVEVHTSAGTTRSEPGTPHVGWRQLPWPCERRPWHFTDPRGGDRRPRRHRRQDHRPRPPHG